MFTLPELPFSVTALEPLMSRDTLQTHHGKHHAGYIKKLNAELAEHHKPQISLEDLVRTAAGADDKGLFNNAAQSWNHAFFWNSLAPPAAEAPQGALKAALETQFGSLERFHDEFVTEGVNHFGSGWIWLTADVSGRVTLETMHDAGSPIVDRRVTPLLTCDLWEHAYYLDYKNERARFLIAYISNLANWRFAESQYETAKAVGRQGWTFPT